MPVERGGACYIVRMKTQRDIPVVFYQEDGKWLAQSLGVEVASFGDTLEEAKAAIREALELYFDDDPEVHPVRDAPTLTPTA